MDDPFLCLGAFWQAGIINLNGRAADGGIVSLLYSEGDEIALAADGPRRCIGATPPGEPHRLPCPTNTTLEKGEQCDTCAGESHLLACMLCTGERCGNPLRRKRCIEPDNHAVYLAAWAPGVVKVGVARWERRLARLSEQGAREALIVGRADGKEARRLEAQIKWLGAGRRKRGEDAGSAHLHRRDSQAVDDRLSPTEKLAAWTAKVAPGQLADEIAHRLSLLRRRIPSAAWLAEPQPVELPVLPALSCQPRLLAAEGLRLRGTVVGCYGQTLVVENDLNELVALVPEKLAALTLRPLADGEQATEQISLALVGSGY